MTLKLNFESVWDMMPKSMQEYLLQHTVDVYHDLYDEDYPEEFSHFLKHISDKDFSAYIRNMCENSDRTITSDDLATWGMSAFRDWIIDDKLQEESITQQCEIAHEIAMNAGITDKVERKTLIRAIVLLRTGVYIDEKLERLNN